MDERRHHTAPSLVGLGVAQQEGHGWGRSDILNDMDGALGARIQEIGAAASVSRIAVAIHDFATGAADSFEGDRWFHAASTIKVAILVAVAAGLDDGRFHATSRLAVRNRFLSVADGEPYRIASSRDANVAVHANIGRTMVLDDLARHMIVTSSNLRGKSAVSRLSNV